METEVVVNCETGEVVIQPDTFLVSKPVFVPPPLPPDPLAAQKAALETAVTADVQAGKMSADTATALQDLLNAMAPH